MEQYEEEVRGRMACDHDSIARRLALKFNATHRRQGVDILSKGRAMEVACTKGDLYQSIGQLKKSRAPKKYMVLPRPLIPSAKELLKGSGIGIMNTKGQIRKRPRRKG